MKAKSFVFSITLLASILAMANTTFAATNEVGSLLQKGLFEEEANRNLDAAIQAYQMVITQTEKDHQFAATAVFRLGECYRKLGRTNDATAQYQRILREFSDQTELAKLSRDYVGGSSSPTGTNFQERLQQIVQKNEGSEEDSEVKRLQEILKSSPDLINARDNQRSPLTAAASKNQLKVATFLLENKADTEVRDNGMTPLMVAASRDNVEMATLLLNHGANANAQRQLTPLEASSPTDGYTALHFAVEKGFKSMAELLLNHGAKVNAQNRADRTPLHVAAEKGFKAVTELLLDHGAEVEKMDQDRATAFYVAVNAGNRAIAELLLAHKTDVNTARSQGWTPLIAAGMAGNKGMIELLLANKANVNGKASDGLTALAAAAMSAGRSEAMKILLEHGADVNARRNDPAPYHAKYAALHEAITLKDRDEVELLLNYKADPNAVIDINNNQNTTPLLLAVSENEADIVRLLLEHQADPNRATSAGITPLHWAMSGDGQITIAELLLGHGADVNARDERGKTPLHWAVGNNTKALVELLLAHHADVNAKDKDGNTPLDLRITRNSNSPGPGAFAPRAVSVGNSVPLAYQWMTPGAASAANSGDDISAILRAQGAVTELERGTIRYTRKGFSTPAVAFRRGVPLQENLTLFDVVAQIYIHEGTTATISEPFGLQFPDFAKIKITRLTSGGTNTVLDVDLESVFQAGDCGKNITLQWGDVAEIPEMDHNVKERWLGLSQPARDTLKKCLDRSVEIIVKGKSIKVAVVTDMHYIINAKNVNGTPTWHTPAHNENSSSSQVLSPWLRDVVNGANVVLASSDLTRVKVKRTNPTTHNIETATFNLEQNTPDSQLLLRDGDVIEIPEKE